MSRYERRYGKLVEKFGITVDAEMRKLVEDAKALGFDVQEWARDRLYAGKGDLIEFISSKNPKSAA